MSAMELRELFYYHRQYRSYSSSGMVPKMACESCEVLYYPRLKDDDLWLWCMSCDYFFQPGMAINSKVVELVKYIED